jgi:hypothetical protein
MGWSSGSFKVSLGIPIVWSIEKGGRKIFLLKW